MVKKRPEIADIENRFAYHPATTTTGPKHDDVRAVLLRVALKMQRDLPDGREKSLVLTKLEETMFWANAAIARHGESIDDAATPAPSGRTSTDEPRKRAARTARTIKKTQAKATATRRVARRAGR